MASANGSAGKIGTRKMKTTKRTPFYVNAQSDAYGITRCIRCEIMIKYVDGRWVDHTYQIKGLRETYRDEWTEQNFLNHGAWCYKNSVTPGESYLNKDTTYDHKPDSLIQLVMENTDEVS